MDILDFIVHDGLRTSLGSDLRELERCLQAGSWKAALVLSGSIVETLLVDALLSTDYVRRSGKDPLKLELADLVQAAKTEGLISSRIADLCAVVRSYRNLIHPGRVVRLQERLDPDDARIAASLVQVVAKELAAKREETFGLTAAQLLAKIEHDSSVGAILPHLLKDLNDGEREKLLLRALPELYMDREAQELLRMEEEYERTLLLDRLSTAFRMALDGANDNLKKRVAAQYVELVRNGAEATIATHGLAFFRCTDLQHVEAKHLPIMKEHVLARLAGPVTDALLVFATGIEPHLTEGDLNRWLDPLVRAYIASSTTQTMKDQLKTFLNEACGRLGEVLYQRVLNRLDSWVTSLKGRSQVPQADLLQDLRHTLEMPF